MHRTGRVMYKIIHLKFVENIFVVYFKGGKGKIKRSLRTY